MFLQDFLTAPALRRHLDKRSERVTAYRQLQGISHMTEQLHHRGIGDYEVPAGCHVEPAGEGQRRVVVPRNGVPTAFMVNPLTRTMVPVLADGVQDVALLVLVLDQGSIGCAAAGFMDHMRKTVLIRFEKIHRLIRDLRGPMGKCCKGSLTKAAVFSSYIWNLSAKPWGSGWFGTVLQRALNIWCMNTDVHNARFQKYLPRIAEELGRPYTTLEEQQAIYHYVCELPSLKLRGEISKHGRWFSWNASAKTHLPHFSATKMIIEQYLEGPGQPLDDPDAGGNDTLQGFGDVEAAARATPQATITKLRQEGRVS